MFSRKRITGIVEKHLGRGIKLGFPTANLKAPTDIEDGIYVGLTRIHNPSQPPLSLRGGVPPLKIRGGEGELFPSLIFIGMAKTFGDSVKRLEVYILDFNHDIYGQEITVRLLKKIRDNVKFDSEAALVDQMKQDEKCAQDFFKTYGRIE